jgi:hypothetical protein
MKTMWVDERIEATVEFPRGLAFPHLRGIRFRGEAIEFAGPVHVDRTPSALLYRTTAGAREYTVRFETAGQRWVLEVVRDASLSG